MDVRAQLEEIYRADSRRVLATLIRLLGDFDLAEDALHDAFTSALERWPTQGVPANPAAWLVSAGRFKGIDALRKRARLNSSLAAIASKLEEGADDFELGEQAVKDDQLRLVFTCCHPALSPEARVALTLREVCGLTTEEIARAFLSNPPTVAQRIVRAKAKIRDAGIPYRIPTAEDLPARLDAVLQVIYLVFNEGYSASSGASVTRGELSGEAIRLGRLLLQLLPDPEVAGLLALMLLQESRRAARSSASGDLVLLENQDRSLWDARHIEEGLSLVRQALATRRFGAYTVQAAIAAVHAEAKAAAETDWREIVALYDMLLEAEQSPVIELNRAVALAMRDGAEVGLQAIDRIMGSGELEDYYLAHSARADLCRRLGRNDEAREAYLKALRLTQQEPERRFLEGRLKELDREKLADRGIRFRITPAGDLRRGTPHIVYPLAMKYMLLVYGDEAALSEGERQECYRESVELTQDLHNQGKYLGASPLHRTSMATSVRLREGKRLITDGPFAETREQLGGFYLVDAEDLDDALNIASRIPVAKWGTIEVRPVVELEGLP